MVVFNLATSGVKQAPSAIIGFCSFSRERTCSSWTVFQALVLSRLFQWQVAMLGSEAGS